MMMILELTEAQENEFPGECKAYWQEVAFATQPPVRVRDRNAAVRRLGKTGKLGTFMAIPESYLENAIIMEKVTETKEVVREKKEQE